MSDKSTGCGDDELPWDFGHLSKAAEMRLRLQYGHNDPDRQRRLIERDLRNARTTALKVAQPSAIQSACARPTLSANDGDRGEPDNLGLA